MKKLSVDDRKVFGLIIAYMIVCGIRYFEHILSVANSCLYILSYRHGFTSRGLVGHIWLWLNDHTPFNLVTYSSEYILCQLLTGILFIFFLAFIYVSLRLMPEDNKRNARYLLVLFSIFSFPMFLTMENFGRIDIFLIMITIACLILIMYEKAEWLIIPLCVLAMLIHQGFVFTNVNIILVLLFYKAIMVDEKKRKVKYYILFGLTLVTVSVFFLYFEIFKTTLGIDVYKELVALNKQVSPDGNYYKELLQHEILGNDVYEMETKYHIENIEELPLAIVAFIPYILIGISFLKNLFKKAVGIKEKLAYLAVIVGVATLIPEWLLKVDFGRYVYSMAFYYIAIVICLMILEKSDGIVARQLQETKEMIKAKTIMPYLLLVYPAVLMPLRDIAISQTTINILRMLRLQE